MRDPKRELKLFILRYHGQQAIVGLIMFVAIGASLWILFALIGFLGLHDTLLRTILFFTYLLAFIGLSIKYWIPGLMALMGFGSRLSEKAAARIIKKWLPGLDDRYINLLELEESEYRNTSPELWKRGLESRTEEVSGFPIETASPWKEIMPVMKWLAVPIVFVCLLLVLGKWKWVEEGSTAVWAYQRVIERVAPFRFIIDSKELVVEKGGSLSVEVFTEGSVEPIEVLAEFGGVQQKLRKRGEKWLLTLGNISKSGILLFNGSGVRSAPVNVRVVENARLDGVNIELVYPPYTGMENELRDWSNRVSVPRGTEVKVSARRIGALDWRASFAGVNLDNNKDGFSFQGSSDGSFVLSLLNGLEVWQSWGQLDVDVFADEYPLIDVDYTVRDSIVSAVVNLKDDFGLSKLVWIAYGIEGELFRKDLSIKGTREEVLDHMINLSVLNKEYPNARSWAYLISDNDQPNGFKKSLSDRYTLDYKSAKESLDALRSETAAMSSGASSSQKELEKQERLLEEIVAESVSGKMDWNEKNRIEEQVEDLIKGQKARESRLSRLEESLKAVKTESKADDKDEILKRLDEAKKQNEGIDLKKLEELLKKEKKVELLKLLKETQKDEKEAVFTEEQLVELLKNMDVELRFEQSLEDLEKLKLKQEELVDTKDQDVSKQEDLNKELDKWNKEYEEMLKSNEDLKDKFEIESLLIEREEVLKEAEEASEASKSGDSEKEQKEQKESAEKLSEMLEALSGMAQAMSEDAHEENMETLRQIQDNLLLYSHREEMLGTLLKEMDPNDPSITGLMREQQELQQGGVIIEDSLRALAMRIPMIGKTIFVSLKEMGIGASSAKAALAEREVDKGQMQTRYSMMAANELALLLDEVSKKMQAQLKGKKAGKSSCNKPGGGKPSGEGLKKAQKKLMKEMGEKKGKGEKGKKEGEKGKTGKNGKSGKGDSGLNGKEFSELLQQQEALRQMLKELMENEDGLGGGVDGEELMELMDESEAELAEMILNDASMERQKEIETRLLESDDAKRERGEEERRESSGMENRMDEIGAWSEENQMRLKEIERIQQVPIKFKHFYKERIVKVPLE